MLQTLSTVDQSVTVHGANLLQNRKPKPSRASLDRDVENDADAMATPNDEHEVGDKFHSLTTADNLQVLTLAADGRRRSSSSSSDSTKSSRSRSQSYASSRSGGGDGGGGLLPIGKHSKHRNYKTKEKQRHVPPVEQTSPTSANTKNIKREKNSAEHATSIKSTPKSAVNTAGPVPTPTKSDDSISTINSHEVLRYKSAQSFATQLAAAEDLSSSERSYSVEFSISSSSEEDDSDDSNHSESALHDDKNRKTKLQHAPVTVQTSPASKNIKKMNLQAQRELRATTVGGRNSKAVFKSPNTSVSGSPFSTSLRKQIVMNNYSQAPTAADDAQSCSTVYFSDSSGKYMSENPTDKSGNALN